MNGFLDAVWIFFTINDFFPLFSGLCILSGTLLGLSAPRGLHFSEVTDSTAIVHWSSPRFTVDNYRITYVPSEGGENSTTIFSGV